MAVRDVFERVDHDLEQGHTHVAIQRLSSLVNSKPANLEVRARLAAVHLATGNLVAAGRWGFLTEEVPDEAIVAFERAQQHPTARWNDLRWQGDDRVLGPRARARLAALKAAQLTAREPRAFRAADGKVDLAEAGCAFTAAAIALVLAVCAVTGAITIVDALF